MWQAGGECLLERTFVFEREETQQSSIVDIAIPALPAGLDLTSLFLLHCPPAHHRLSLYDPEANAFVPLASIAHHGVVLPRRLLEPRVILVRFRRREAGAGRSESESAAGAGAEGRGRKERNRERTIGEAIELVRRWRTAHLESARSGLRRLSLADAAKSTGVSKKTLDDYYYQLRLGEFYSFDFARCLGEKVGVLRAFVREFRPGREDKNRNLRHPRSLKVIKAFELGLPAFRGFSLEEPFTPQRGPGLCEPQISQLLSTHEDKFFKNFEFLLDDPNDPFLEIERDFKRKSLEEISNDFFFF